MLDSIFSFINIILGIIVGVTIQTLAIFGIGGQIPTPRVVEAPVPENIPALAVPKEDVAETAETEDITPSLPFENMDDLVEQAQTTFKDILAQQTLPQADSNLNTEARDALVNILCQGTSGNIVNSISGSGIIIDDRGVILTNAHVAQFFLLQDYLYNGFLECVIRIGAPAQFAYNATPLFISPSWIKENTNAITQSDPIGTGENDFALLLITDSISGASLPEKFPYIKYDMNEDTLALGTPLLVVGYPAGFLGGVTIQKNLWPVSTVSNIKEIFTFGGNFLDLFSMGGNIVAQKGSSGGGVISMTIRKLIGIIVTSTQAETTADRNLNAITVSHISRSLYADLGVTLPQFLSGNLTQQSTSFNKTLAPTLKELLVQELEK